MARCCHVAGYLALHASTCPSMSTDTNQLRLGLNGMPLGKLCCVKQKDSSLNPRACLVLLMVTKRRTREGGPGSPLSKENLWQGKSCWRTCCRCSSELVATIHLEFPCLMRRGQSTSGMSSRSMSVASRTLQGSSKEGGVQLTVKSTDVPEALHP